MERIYAKEGVKVVPYHSRREVNTRPFQLEDRAVGFPGQIDVVDIFSLVFSCLNGIPVGP